MGCRVGVVGKWMGKQWRGVVRLRRGVIKGGLWGGDSEEGVRGKKKIYCEIK